MPLRIYRRRLPHWRIEGATYFVTWRLHRGRCRLHPSERDLVVDVLRHFEKVRYELLGWVVMDDHIHVLVTPQPDWELGRILHTWKSVSAYQLQRHHSRRGAIWQHDSHDRIVRNREELIQKVTYIRRNPIVRWPELDRYRWLWWDPAAYASGE